MSGKLVRGVSERVHRLADEANETTVGNTRARGHFASPPYGCMRISSHKGSTDHPK